MVEVVVVEEEAEVEVNNKKVLEKDEDPSDMLQ